MSRLAETLMRMDRGALRPVGVGGIPRLTASRKTRWRRAIVLVIVVGVVVISGTTIMLRPRSAPVSIAHPSVPLAPSRLAPPRPSRPSAAERFDALMAQGRRAVEEGNPAEAAGFFRQALELRPTDAGAWNGLGVALVLHGETASGVDALRKALRFAPNHAEAHRNLAVALDRQGKSSEAVSHYRAFLGLSAESDPARDDVRRRLAEVPVANPGPGKPR
jgi:Tfp pilus assembly protein PilF